MGAVKHRAVDDVLLGLSPTLKPGDPVPETFKDWEGNDLPVDLERLLELGVIVPEDEYEAPESDETPDGASDDEDAPDAAPSRRRRGGKSPDA